MDSGKLARTINVERSGNRCGHDPHRPLFYTTPKHHARRPDVIQYAQHNLRQYYANPAGVFLPSLRISRESSRKCRSEGRERDAQVLGLLLQYADLASLRVGFNKDDGSFQSLDMRFIAKQLGWRTAEDEAEDRALIESGQPPKLRGIKRVWRSINALKQAGLLTVHPRCEALFNEHGGDYRGLPAIRRLSLTLFLELGIKLAHLKKKRDEAAKRLKRRLKKLAEQAAIAVSKTAATVTSFASAVGRRQAKTSYGRERQSQDRAQREKARLQRYMTLKGQADNQALSTDAFLQKHPELLPERWHQTE